MTFRHSLAVRYGECDMQGVVFNAHYLAFADDAIARWLAAALPQGSMHVAGNDAANLDFMVKKATVTWVRGSTFGDVIDLDCSVARWGTTSLGIAVAGSVDGEERFLVELVYVCVTPGTHTPIAVPPQVRELLV